MDCFSPPSLAQVASCLGMQAQDVADLAELRQETMEQTLLFLGQRYAPLFSETDETSFDLPA